MQTNKLDIRRQACLSRALHGWEELLVGSDDELPVPNIGINDINSLLLAASGGGRHWVTEVDKLFLQALQSYELIAS